MLRHTRFRRALVARCPRFRCVYTWVILIVGALRARPSAAIDPCPFTTTTVTVEDTAGARDLAEAVNCSGGTFNVQWHGAVVVDASIAVGQGSSLNITGVGADASVDGDGATQLFVVSGASLALSSVQLTNGFAEGGGAAINAVSSVLVLKNTSFRGNTGRYFIGGAMRVDDSVVSFSGETIMHDNFANYGAGIYITGQASVVSWSGVSTFFNNTCSEYGCAVYATGGGRVLWSGETTFELNKSLYGAASAVNLRDAVNASWSGRTAFMSNTDGGHSGSVVALSSSTLSFVGETSFANNTGAVQLMSSTCVWKGKTDFSNNIPTNDREGGAIYMELSDVSWSGETHFTNNAVGWNGGALRSRYSNVTWSGYTYFTGNTAYYGGALYAFGSNVSWTGETNFTNNTVSLAGGALSIADSDVSCRGKTHFTRNIAVTTGGAISMSDSAMSLGGETVFSHNMVRGEGGAIYSAGEDDGDLDLVIKGITHFDDNHSGANGGAIALDGNLRVSSRGGAERTITFTRNSAAYSGGAVYLSTITKGFDLTAVIFSENTASTGGAVYSLASGTLAIASGTLIDSPITYDGCCFRDNVATTTGGAVESVSGYDYFVNTSFVNNTAGSGGGVMLAGMADMLNCDFSTNNAYEEAPAVRNIGNLRNMTNVSFAGNILLCDAETFLDYVEDDEHYDTICHGCPECRSCEVENVGGLACTAQYEHSHSDGIAVTLETLLIEQGFWRATNSSRANGILACYNEDACEGGVTGSAGYCAKGYTGPYCSTCTSGFAETLAYTCQRCLADWQQLMLATMVGATVAVAGVAFVLYMVSKVSAEGVVQHGPLFTRLRGLMRSLPLQSLKVIIVTWQILTQFDAVANACFPAFYGRFLDGIAAGVSFDLGWVLSAACFMDVDFHDHLLAATIGPIALLCLLGGTYLVATRRNSSSPQALGVVRRKHASAVLLLTFLVYSSVSSTVFRMFACESLDDGYTYLRADYAILCDSAKHEALQVYAAFMIAVYPVGIPLLYAFVLIRNRDLLRDGDRRMCDISPECQSTADLWKAYKPSRFYFELIECGRRVALTGIIVFTFPNTAAQVATTIVIAFVFVMVSESLDPYLSELDAWLSRVGHAVVFLSFFLALLVKVDVSDEREYSAEVFGGVLIAVNMIMVLAVITEAVFTLRTSFGTEGDRVREDSLPRKASTNERREITRGCSSLHNKPEHACEHTDVEQEAPPDSIYCISKSKHKIAPNAVENTCNGERGTAGI